MQLFLRIATKNVCAIKSVGGFSIKNILSCWKKVVLLQIFFYHALLGTGEEFGRQAET